MKKLILLTLLSALPCMVHGQAGVVVFSPTLRQNALDKAKHLIAPKDSRGADKLKDPFNPEIVVEESDNQTGPGNTGTGADRASQPRQGPRTDRELLSSIAAAIKPSGYVVLGGEPTLIFGQKRVKAGNTLTITFEGVEYILQITSINRTSFTLRLNREEFTRPIK